MGKGHRWLKRMLKDRVYNLSRIQCDKLFFLDKLNELGGEKKELVLRKRLSELIKKQDENEKATVKDDKLGDEIKVVNKMIDTIVTITQEYNACDAKMAEFHRYIKVIKNTLADPDQIKKFNKFWQ